MLFYNYIERQDIFQKNYLFQLGWLIEEIRFLIQSLFLVKKFFLE